MTNNQKLERKLTAEGWRRRECVRIGRRPELVPAQVSVNVDKKPQAKQQKSR